MKVWEDRNIYEDITMQRTANKRMYNNAYEFTHTRYNINIKDRCYLGRYITIRGTRIIQTVWQLEV